MAAIGAMAVPPAPAAAGGRVVSRLGVAEIDHSPAIVQVLVSVPAGADEEAATGRALAAAGATPVEESAGDGGFAVLGFTWPQFSDPSRLPPRNDRPVVQYYNPTGDPTGADNLTTLVNTHRAWSSVETSAYRIELGGTTTRCPSLVCFFGRYSLSQGYLDDFNDVGWVSMPFEPETLGVAVFALDPSERTLLEADVALNSSSPLFTTDPEHADDARSMFVESVMLHENGHVAGLAHSDDPATVMFPILDSIRRQLTPGDEAGITFLYPLDPPREHPGHPLHPEHPVHPPPPTLVLATLGDGAPGVGTIVGGFQVGNLTDAGRASYATGLHVNGEDAGEAVFTADRHRVYEIARSGQPAPGGGTLGLGILGRPHQDEAGNIAFAFLLEPFNLPFGVNAGVYAASASGGDLRAVMVPGVTAAPDGSTFAGARNATAGGGSVVFNGIVPLASGELAAGLYREQAGRITAIAAPGAAMPGGRALVEASGGAVNKRGDAVFAANLEGDPCFPFPEFDVGCDHPSNAFLQRADTGTFETVVAYGMPAPGIENGRLDFVGDMEVNESREVVFVGRGTVAPEDFSFGSVVYLYRNGTLTPIIRSGDPLPGGGHLFNASLVSLNDGGDLAFIGTLDIDLNRDRRFDDGVYVVRDGVVRLIAKAGTQIPRVGTIARIFGTGLVGIGINDRGQVMFPARLTDGRTVLLLAG